MSATTSRLCCNTSRAIRRSKSSISAADPGAISRRFAALGHTAVGLEGCRGVCRHGARPQRLRGVAAGFLKLDLPDSHFDGVFANAALFHVPSQELPRVLRELRASLKPGGVLFTSIPHGHNEEGWSGERYGVYHDLAAWRRYLSGAGFCRAHALLPAQRPAARAAALAGKRLAAISRGRYPLARRNAPKSSRSGLRILPGLCPRTSHRIPPGPSVLTARWRLYGC